MAVLYYEFCYVWEMRLFCIVIFLRLFSCSDPVNLNPLPQSDPLKIIKDHCPSFMTCDAEGTYNESTNTTNSTFDGCCLHCDCSDACFLKGNCCHGKEQRRVATSGTCVQTFLDYRSAGIFRKSSFILQTSNLPNCDEEVFAKCITPNTSSLIEVTPVTSNRINYRNVFCAKCDGHQDAEIQSWPTRISCVQSFLSNNLLKRNGESDFQMLERLSSAFCQIFWDPIYPEVTQPCFHKNDIISTCSPYYRFEGAEFAIKHCQSMDFNESFTVPVYYGFSIYKNVFCAFCNFASISQAENQAVNCTSSLLAEYDPGMPGQLFITILDMTIYNMPESPAHCWDYNTVSVSLLLSCQ